MDTPDIWGSVVPAWLSAIGGIAAAIVAVIALVKSIRNQGGVETLREAANSMTATEPGSRMREARVSWTAWQSNGTNYMLRNDSTDTGVTAKLTGIRDVTPGGGRLTYNGTIPLDLAPGEAVPFVLHRPVLGGPSVRAVEITWTLGGEESWKHTLYLATDWPAGDVPY